QEALALASLSHPNVLTIYDAQPRDYEGEPYLVCELLEGETLREKTSLSAATALEIAVQIADGLAAAHAKGIIHRDLKPENVFITREGGARLIDLGMAKVPARVETVTEDEPSPPETAEGTAIGTAGYMAPEQLRGETVDARTDLFAFGALLYEMLSDRRAFR